MYSSEKELTEGIEIFVKSRGFTKMKISIIIPVYKVEKLLPRCIESVLRQSYSNLEILLINDGSPDRSGEICDAYAEKDRRIRVIHKQNEGVSATRNLGIREASGDYIFFLDSDDFLPEHAIATLQNVAIKTDADIIISNYSRINENNEITKNAPFPVTQEKPDFQNDSQERLNFYFHYGVEVWNRLYKLSFVKDNQVFFDKGVYYAEDCLFNLKLFANNPEIAVVNEYTYYYYYNINSVANTYKKNLFENFALLLEKYIQYLEGRNKVDEYQDMISLRAFSSIDSVCQNCYRYSKSKVRDIRHEIRRFKNHTPTNLAIKELIRGGYLKNIQRNDWKYFSWLFSILFNNNMLGCATILQILRFSITERKYKDN